MAYIIMVCIVMVYIVMAAARFVDCGIRNLDTGEVVSLEDADSLWAPTTKKGRA